MGNHKEWRKLAKKLRRKRIRQQIAQTRDAAEVQELANRENSPTYHRWIAEKEQHDNFQLQEETRISQEAHENWLRVEEEARKQWLKLQEKLALARTERIKQQTLIKEQWETEQKRLKEIKEQKQRELEKKRKAEELLQERIENYITDGGDLPAELKQSLESNPGKPVCPFFSKTGACRFRDSCSRNHIRPTVSKVLLIRNFYTHYSLENSTENEHGGDSSLEFEHGETYAHFKEFFHDVLEEMERFGEVKQFKVCCNLEIHLRGNVYIEYSNCRHAVRTFRALHGRFYAGKQINIEFCGVDSWKNAICGLFYNKRCPKGSVCNFLHVFQNPRNMFRVADRDLHRSPPVSNTSSYSIRNCRWSESPERQFSERKASRSRPPSRRKSSEKCLKNRNKSSERIRRKRSRNNSKYSDRINRRSKK